MRNIEKIKNKLFATNFLRYFFLLFSFCLLDIWLRVVTRWIGWYSIYEVAPNMFTLGWSVVMVSLLLLIPNKTVRKIVYGCSYFLWMIYVIIQYGAYLILDKFLFLTDFLYAKEGLDYTSYIVQFIDINFIAQVLFLVGIGIIGIFIIDRGETSNKLFILIIILISYVVMLFIPFLYGEKKGWASYGYEYEKFTTATRDVEMTGVYQFVIHDAYLQIQKKVKNYDEVYKQIDAYFEEQQESQSNEMTNIFKGKNVIFVMMESMDDWIISSETTPTISRMMESGINFTEMYTPQYSNGYTFNTEFAFNTSVYPFSNGNATYSLTKNNFSSSLANLFKQDGYTVRSFHEGQKSFYNRGEMHKTFGYEKYYSYQDYPGEAISVLNDLYLTESDELWKEVTGEEKFMSFVITYSPHLPYEKDELVEYAASKYPEYNKENLTEEECLRAKARLTDDMFAEMLERLETDGLLQNTVIVAFTDHYSYGIEDKSLLQKLSEDAGNVVLEKTPAFIYCADYESELEVSKVSQITDLGPTVANLFGLERMDRVMGKDIFDSNYEGYAIFPNNTWLTNQAYMKNGIIIWNNGMSQEEIKKMNELAMKQYEINDAILESDYYTYWEK